MEPSDGEGWDRLRTPLLAAAQGSKIVVTSRNESVAITMRAVQTRHLGQLSPQHCWRLFEKLAFQDRDSNAFLELEPIGRQIVDKCQGLPLAVKALGRLLHSKVEKREWEDILNSEIWHLRSGPEILPSLRLSYHHLSLPQKHCFAYCSIFPQDHEFDKVELILLWMAEGLLRPQQSDGRRMEEIETLSFEDMLNWEKWLCCGEFPHLQKLSMRCCPKLTGKLPEQLLSLEELQIYNCPQLLMTSLTVLAIRELKMVDFGKLQLQMAACDFIALQTSEIEILDVSQWKQLPVAPHQLSIRKCDYVESLLEEEILQSNIYDLKIYDCSFSRSLHKVGLPTTLRSLSISQCSKLEFLLPELFRCHLPALQRLRIFGGVIDDSLSLSFSLGIFPELIHFAINGLKGLRKLFISISEGDPTSLCVLGIHIQECPNLESIALPGLKLEYCWISSCSKLRSLAHMHSSIQELCLWDCPELLFQREGLPSKLSELVIGNCNQLMPRMEWGLQRLTSLTHLRMEELPNLKSLDNWGLQQLTSLRELGIINCPELQFSTGSAPILDRSGSPTPHLS
ncbi:putative disease resistance protein RGA1 [Vitis riparia]|uniref:putative disease resistance protein RGA1 n=1 Tax=Vitis riparia TaxID=96939 RepID=UPI00155A47C6|nr:putative disease resistance protein RGA1 [Vitis riparia]